MNVEGHVDTSKCGDDMVGCSLQLIPAHYQKLTIVLCPEASSEIKKI